GKGGTTWSGVEAYRAKAIDDRRGEKLGTLFRTWGIPTVVSTMEAAAVHPSVVASGGVRSGLDIAKAIALGADAGGLAKPFLKPAAQGEEEALEAVRDVISEVRTAMFVTGSKNIDELSNAETVILGNTRQYLEQIRR
ncbi:MAG: alpha-hydroxy-acid oxidizing protein, partial [Halobacteria archaeon]|nr:alpha-hydroxy-acid oxidizing protein [Halobacteria archaeon]